MDRFIDMRHIKNHFAWFHTDPDPHKCEPPLKMSHFKKKRYLFRDAYTAEIYAFKCDRVSCVLDMYLEKNKKPFPRYGDTVSGFIFKDVVPNKIIIEINGKTIKIPTLGKQVALLDIPLFIKLMDFATVNIYSDKDVSCEIIYDLESPKNFKWLQQKNIMCFYNKFLIQYVEGCAMVVYFVRSLKSIVQDLVQDLNINPNVLLMQRSNRDADALADSDIIVFGPTP